MKTWLQWGSAILILALAGCSSSESTSNHRETDTAVTCRSDRVCDLDSLLCTSTFDEVITTFIDEYNEDFDQHITITDHTDVIRTDDINVFETVLASTQTEVLTTTTRDEFISIDEFGHEDITITEATTVTTTTWQQDCPACLVEVCSATDGGVARCIIETRFPAFPVCQ
ncbi:hypothetical protein [Candidatus Entotheonella palauensis]|uniref:hypothetical protein n=1 Tax=Candidatus Entotheonella palauensis TaxID=93172 RepID=UPI000B800554|nr:hypothetical protein [Candidatus Entotheonella palauensis]